MEKDNTRLYLGIDQGTQSSRAIIFNQQGEIEASAQLAVSLLRDGERCEQDGNEILDSLTTVITSVIEQIGADPEQAAEITAAGLATQRSSVIAWDAVTGQPLSPLLSWSDRRGEAFIASIRHQESLVRSRTGLPLTAYYGGSKICWLLTQNTAVKQARQQQRLCIGPLASFLLFNLLQDSPYVVDHANALRTQLFNLECLQWDAELLGLYSVPQHLLPEVKPTQADYGRIKAGNIPLMAVNGDQTAALLAAFPGSECGALVNVGSGAFILSPTGNRPIRSGNLLTGLFHSSSEQREYLLEGTVNGAGSALQWLQHEMPSQELVDLEHAFSKPFSDTIFINGIGGLGSPFWKSLNSGFWSISRECMIEDTQTIDDNLQGLVAESILFLIQANIDAMLEQITGFHQLTITGGIARSDGFSQRLANLSGMEVVRPQIVEATARGIASEAAAENGQWSNAVEERFYPRQDGSLSRRYHTFLALI
jgi:glycerol kinase